MSNTRTRTLIISGVLANLYYEKGAVYKVFQRITSVESRDCWSVEASMNKLLMEEAVPHPNLLICTEIDTPKFTLKFPYCAQGDMFMALRTFKGHGYYELKVKWMKQMVEAVYHLHQVLGIVHLDISLENFMITDTLDVKLGDFAQAYFTKDSLHVSKCYNGKKSYRAVEVTAETIIEDTKALDMWALGVCIFALFFNCFLWSDVSDPRFRVFVTDRPGFWKMCQEFIHITPENKWVIKLVEDLLSPNPEKRLTIVELRRRLTNDINK